MTQAMNTQIGVMYAFKRYESKWTCESISNSKHTYFSLRWQLFKFSVKPFLCANESFQTQTWIFYATMTPLQFDFFSILQCDFFVLNKDTDECHIGEKMGATSTLSDETDKRPAYVDVWILFIGMSKKCYILATAFWVININYMGVRIVKIYAIILNNQIQWVVSWCINLWVFWNNTYFNSATQLRHGWAIQSFNLKNLTSKWKSLHSNACKIESYMMKLILTR